MSSINTLEITDSIRKRGITEAKKKELDTMAARVLAAQNKVEEIQAVVTSLTEKSSKIKAELATRDGNRTKALSNKDLLDTVVDQVTELYKNSKIVVSEIKESSLKIKDVSIGVKELIDKLIYSAEVINKLSNLVIREKASNPLVSDELVTMVGNAGTNANNAVALTLVALNAVFTSQANTIESEAIITLENFQVEKLYEFMTQEATPTDGKLPVKNIKTLIDEMYDNSLVLYASALDANNDITKQLSNETSALDSAKMNLSSLQAGLAAANAAAIAS